MCYTEQGNGKTYAVEQHLFFTLFSEQSSASIDKKCKARDCERKKELIRSDI